MSASAGTNQYLVVGLFFGIGVPLALAAFLPVYLKRRRQRKAESQKSIEVARAASIRFVSKSLPSTISSSSKPPSYTSTPSPLNPNSRPGSENSTGPNDNARAGRKSKWKWSFNFNGLRLKKEDVVAPKAPSTITMHPSTLKHLAKPSNSIDWIEIDLEAVGAVGPDWMDKPGDRRGIVVSREYDSGARWGHGKEWRRSRPTGLWGEKVERELDIYCARKDDEQREIEGTMGPQGRIRGDKNIVVGWKRDEMNRQ